MESLNSMIRSQVAMRAQSLVVSRELAAPGVLHWGNCHVIICGELGCDNS